MRTSNMRQKYPVLLVAGLGGLCTVVNLAFAQTWTPTSAPLENWGAVASSADGTKLVAAGAYWQFGVGNYYPGPICTSTNSGATWTITSAPVTNWTSVASSADGVRLVGAAFGVSLDGSTFSGGPIYISVNSGGTWSQ